jgi:hypothetical protein
MSQVHRVHNFHRKSCRRYWRLGPTGHSDICAGERNGRAIKIRHEGGPISLLKCMHRCTGSTKNRAWLSLELGKNPRTSTMDRTFLSRAGVHALRRGVRPSPGTAV